MDINKLALLCDVSRTGNLTVSAERLGYTQSGVSHAINKLEAEMGITLIRRTKRGVELTADAELLLPYIRQVVTHFERMDEVLDSVHGLQRGSICIGTYCSIASQWLPAVIAKYQQLYPNIAIRIREGGLKAIEKWLNEGSIDFGFLSRQKDQTFSFFPLARDPLCAVIPKDLDIPTEYEKTFPVSAFADFPFIASERGIDEDVSSTLSQFNVSPLVSFTCHDDHTILSMVDNGLGISLLPNMFILNNKANFRIIPIKPCTHRTLGIGYQSEKTLSICSKAFIDLSKKIIPDLVAASDVPECVNA